MSGAESREWHRTGSHDSEGHGSYEVRISGLLGPLLLGALPHAAVSRAPRHALMVTAVGDGVDLLDLLQVLVDSGVEVDSVREIRSPDADEPSEPEALDELRNRRVSGD